MLAHNVYFSLKEPTDKAIDRLIASCHRYLKEHPGVVFFAAGRVAADLARPVNDRDFHVALHVVFQDRAAHDLYQPSESHQAFIEENRESWSQVRVFDSMVDS